MIGWVKSSFSKLVQHINKIKKRLLRRIQLRFETQKYLAELIQTGGIEVFWPANIEEGNSKDRHIRTFIQLTGDVKVTINKQMFTSPDDELRGGYQEHFLEIGSILRNINGLRRYLKVDWVIILVINTAQFFYLLRNELLHWFYAGISILVMWLVRFFLRKSILSRLKSMVSSSQAAS